MPDDDGRLTDEERQRALEWLESKQAPVARCPHCVNNSWGIADHFVTTPRVSGNIIIGGAMYPHSW
jgi:hypothetical protein